jgi:hypothetical protein
MTNGGGANEEDRCKGLTEQLGFEVGLGISLFLYTHAFQDNCLQLHASTYYSEVLRAQVRQQGSARTWGKM